MFRKKYFVWLYICVLPTQQYLDNIINIRNKETIYTQQLIMDRLTLRTNLLNALQFVFGAHEDDIENVNVI